MIQGSFKVLCVASFSLSLSNAKGADAAEDPNLSRKTSIKSTPRRESKTVKLIS